MLWPMSSPPKAFAIVQPNTPLTNQQLDLLARPGAGMSQKRIQPNTHGRFT